jgi:hypothetical protein
MTKMWRRSDEWIAYANCGGSPDHTIPPREYSQGGDESMPFLVMAICRSCRVRPECAEWASKGERGVWAAGRYIPSDDESKSEGARVREELAASVPVELELRGEDV